MLLAKQFGMEYVDVDGQKKTPYIIHRTSLGCYERTLAYLIEEYAGALPCWMAPEQVRFLPVTDRAADRCAELVKALNVKGYRAEAEKRVRFVLAARAIAEAEGITVRPEEVNAEYRRLSVLQDTPEAEIRKVLTEDSVSAALAAKKVQCFLLDHAKVTTVTDPADNAEKE